MPLYCCAARLARDIEYSANILALGDFAAKSILHTDEGIQTVWGDLREVDGRRVTATIHPAATMYPGGARHRDTFYWHTGKAIRYFEGRLRNLPPNRVMNPSPAELRRFLAADPQGWVVWDLETDSILPELASVEIFGMWKPCWGEHGTAVSVTFSGRGGVRYYSGGALREIREILTRALTDGRLWLGYNSGYYDRQVVENRWGVTPSPALDLILEHLLAYPLHPHRLAFTGPALTDFPQWKVDEAGGKRSQTADDKDRALYCQDDCAGTGALLYVLAPKVELRRQDEPLPARPDMTLRDLEAWRQDFCVNLHRQGMYVDLTVRSRLEQEAWDLERQYKAECAKQARTFGVESFNPNSHPQVQRLLYHTIGLEPRGWTDTGAESGADEYLRAHILEDDLQPDVEALIYAIRRYRKVRNKWLGTYLIPIGIPLQPDGSGLLWGDGRVRASWNAHGTPVGRLSASDPALQQQPVRFRTMYRGPFGNKMAGADAAQIHLRIIAALWKVARLQEAFEKGGDPHAVAAEAIFGDLFRNAPGHPEKQGDPWAGLAKKLRTLAKTFQYAAAYGADPPTIHKVLTKAEDEELGVLVMKELTPRKVAAMHRAWLTSMPEFERGWDLEVNLAVANGMRTGEPPWLMDPVVGRRRDFPGGSEEERNEIRNARVIMTESAIMHLCTIELLKELPFMQWGPGTGIVVQVHDSITAECPADEAERTARLIADALTCRVPGLDVPFTADPTWGDSWKEA